MLLLDHRKLTQLLDSNRQQAAEAFPSD